MWWEVGTFLLLLAFEIFFSFVELKSYRVPCEFFYPHQLCHFLELKPVRLGFLHGTQVLETWNVSLQNSFKNLPTNKIVNKIMSNGKKSQCHTCSVACIDWRIRTCHMARKKKWTLGLCIVFVCLFVFFFFFLLRVKTQE